MLHQPDKLLRKGDYRSACTSWVASRARHELHLSSGTLLSSFVQRGCGAYDRRRPGIFSDFCIETNRLPSQIFYLQCLYVPGCWLTEVFREPVSKMLYQLLSPRRLLKAVLLFHL